MTEADQEQQTNGVLGRRQAVGLTTAAVGGASLFWLNRSRSPNSSLETRASTPEPADSEPLTGEALAEVDESGFDITLGPIYVSAPAGVAPSGTSVAITMLSDAESPEMVEFGDSDLVGQAFEIILGDGIQPEQPITIEMDLGKWNASTTAVSEDAPLVLASFSELSDEPIIDEVMWDPATNKATAVIEHLSLFGFLKIDLKHMLTDFLLKLLSLQHPKPACAYNPSSHPGGTYSVRPVTGDTLWPCVSVEDGALVLDLHSNSVLPWAVTTSPRVSGSITGDFIDPSFLIGHVYQEMHRLYRVQRSIVMSGKTTTFRFTGAGRLPSIHVEVDRPFFVAGVAIALVSAVLERLRLKDLAKLLRDSVGALQCIAQTINTTYKESAEEVARNGFVTALTCIAEWLGDAAKASGKLLAATITSVASLVITGASSLAGVVVLFLSDAAGTSSFSIHIDYEAESQADSGSGMTPGSMPMAHGSPARTGEMPGPVPRLDQPLVAKWEFPIGVPTGALPVIQDGVVVISSGDKNIYAIDAETGTERWRHAQADQNVYTATMYNGMVYFCQRTTLSINHLCALDIQTGATKWMYEIPLNGGSLIAAVDGVVYGTGQEGSVYALEAATGREVWSRSLGEHLVRTPTVADGLLYVGHNHTLLALDSLTGTSRWQYPMENDLNFPTVAGDMVYCRSLNSAVHAIDKNSGEKRWEFRSSGPLQGQVVSDGVVYIANNETQLVALDALTGSELWRTDGIRTLPTVVNGIAYVTDVDDALCALDPDSGNLLNKARFDIPLSWRTYVNGVIYGLDRDGNLIAAENAESPTLLSDVVVRGAPSHSGIERGTANAGEGIGRVGAQDVRSGQTWVDVTINGVTGWIPLDAIDSSTLPAEDGLRYVFRPEGDH